MEQVTHCLSFMVGRIGHEDGSVVGRQLMNVPEIPLLVLSIRLANLTSVMIIRSTLTAVFGPHPVPDVRLIPEYLHHPVVTWPRPRQA